jgi:hypothetical protein
MTSRSALALGTVVAVLVMGGIGAGWTQTGAADASKTANPELVGELAKELKVTPQQAEGAAGALFGIAKDRLPAGDWGKVEKAVPGMAGLLKAAPAVPAGTTGGGAGAVAGAASGLGKAAGGLGGAAAAFSKLGLKPEMVSTAVPVLTRYVGKTGGADVASLLAGALK